MKVTLALLGLASACSASWLDFRGLDFRGEKDDGGKSLITTVVVETSTTVCPVTETKTVSGKEVVTTYTTTSTIVTCKPRAHKSLKYT